MEAHESSALQERVLRAAEAVLKRQRHVGPLELLQQIEKAPDLVVFQKVSEEGQCAECGGELGQGELLFMENGKPLCLVCAELDHLEFLPSGDIAMTRRARQHSPLSAVVVTGNRGILSSCPQWGASRFPQRFAKPRMLPRTNVLDHFLGNLVLGQQQPIKPQDNFRNGFG